ncbi:MAG TPA: alpha-1,4-glucan--maltose-1-phosphate maltosyltransferase [Vicinamibacterales bacterium]|nr:alpha-1,4-glucan--maltose-1-phosphate maltosyltransferase [Vicinamibacterales bacterium]
MTRPPLPTDDRPRRAVIDAVHPQVDGGRFPIKRTAGERVQVSADIFVDGHDRLDAVLCYRLADAPASPVPQDRAWREVPMVPAGEDRWSASFMVETLGRWEYTVQAWVDRFASWREELQKKYAAGLDVASELLEGAFLVRQAAGRLPAGGTQRVPQPGSPPLREWLLGRAFLLEGPDEMDLKVSAALADSLAQVMADHADRSLATRYHLVLSVSVERPRARFGAWYEFFPRSGSSPDRGATFAEAASRLPDIAAMGFDIVYLPPIHPIGRSYRKGPNNTLNPGPHDPGSPWAIGAPEGGHTAVHPGLGDLAAFREFVATARRFNLEVALDIAFQASPDHPWVAEHPEWFHHRPDGTIKYAENPPKKYQDIYPFHFESAEGWRELWRELAGVFFFWIEQGVKIFRVDNPHTKPFRFWEWTIEQVRRDHPDAIFLAEAFTRPKPMCYLAKAGFSQSYTYFTWRNTRWELTSYFEALARQRVREYMRPNLFANTPDILPHYLQQAGRPAFVIRLVLAATLGAAYGIYSGFELCENEAVPGTEEYLDSEKYQLKPRDYDRPGNIKEIIARVNQARHTNQALHYDDTLRFHEADNDQIICYSKISPDGRNRIFVVVSLDPFNPQEGFVRVPVADMDLGARPSYAVRDLLNDNRYTWQGDWNFVRLDPAVTPAHILRIEG